MEDNIIRLLDSGYDIIRIDYGRGHMRIIPDTFFPCNQTDFRKLLKIIELDFKNADEILEYLQKYLTARLEVEKFSPRNTKAYVDKLGRNINLLMTYCMGR